MTDEEWEERRKRAILATFLTGRSVFADTDGVLRYADGDREALADEAGAPQAPLPDASVTTTWWERLKRRLGARS